LEEKSITGAALISADTFTSMGNSMKATAGACRQELWRVEELAQVHHGRAEGNTDD
jgi:hypothetical protein